MSDICYIVIDFGAMPELPGRATLMQIIFGVMEEHLSQMQDVWNDSSRNLVFIKMMTPNQAACLARNHNKHSIVQNNIKHRIPVYVYDGVPPEPEPSSSIFDSTKASANERKDDFVCNICLETAQDTVVSVCGHLFCWPCIHQWMQTSGVTCPVCNSPISKEKFIKLYGRGSNRKVPRNTNSPQPADKRNKTKWVQNFLNFIGDVAFGGDLPIWFHLSLNFIVILISVLFNAADLLQNNVS
uniref:RING-type E3 ubiquitin transferase n=1 Tax=Culex pipiens TaxID=7175 RepID=A0A8D8DW55_CULPI